MKSHFYAYISKTRWLQRWGLKRNTVQENVMEHSWEVATIAHGLALISNRYFGNQLDANAIAVAAMYHDCSEVITGDMPSPIKYHSADITKAYKSIEHQADKELLSILPVELQTDYESVLIEDKIPKEHRIIIKYADTISAYIKCQMEVSAGNAEFATAKQEIKKKLESIEAPEVKYFLEVYSPSYSLTLDELLKNK